MSDVATDTAPAPNADTAPDGNADNTQTTDTQDTNDGGRTPLSDSDNTNTDAFSVPDEYKDKPWASKIKSNDDAYKQIENLTELVGKKTIQPIDYETASEEDIASYHASLAPKDVSAYEWGEDSMKEITDPMGEVFQEAGLHPYQQKLISQKFDGIITQLAGDQLEADTSEEGYMKMMEESFGEEYKTSVGIVEKALKEHASNDDKKVFDSVDNKTRAAVDRTVHALTKKYEDRIANILKEHGVEESGAQTEGGEGSNSGVDVEKKRASLRAEIRELDGKPFSYEKVEKLKKQLHATYEEA